MAIEPSDYRYTCTMYTATAIIRPEPMDCRSAFETQIRPFVIVSGGLEWSWAAVGSKIGLVPVHIWGGLEPDLRRKTEKSGEDRCD